MTNKNNNLVIGIVVIIVILILLGGFGGYGMMGGFNPGFMIVGWIFNLLVIILIIIGIFWVIRNVSYNGKKLKFN